MKFYLFFLRVFERGAIPFLFQIQFILYIIDITTNILFFLYKNKFIRYFVRSKFYFKIETNKFR